MAIANFLKNFGKVQGERVEDGMVNLAVLIDRDGVAETAIKQKQDEHNERIKILAEAKESYKKEYDEYKAEQDIHDRFMNEAEAITELLANPGDHDVAELNKDLDFIVGKLEAHAPKLAKEKQDADEAEAWLKQAQEGVDEISAELLQLREAVDQAKIDNTKAEQELERNKKKAKQAEILAGLAKSGNKFDVAMNALNKKAAETRREADEYALKAASLTKPKVDDGSSILGKYSKAATAAPSTESLQERLARLKAK